MHVRILIEDLLLSRGSWVASLPNSDTCVADSAAQATTATKGKTTARDGSGEVWWHAWASNPPWDLQLQRVPSLYSPYASHTHFLSSAFRKERPSLSLRLCVRREGWRGRGEEGRNPLGPSSASGHPRPKTVGTQAKREGVTGRGPEQRRGQGGRERRSEGGGERRRGREREEARG